jgi:FAD/FMN-containing dehydrogenase
VTLRHFPQSFAFSILGGWLATRAGGHFATLYTPAAITDPGTTGNAPTRSPAVRATKSVLDPAGILNPGVLIDPGAS